MVGAGGGVPGRLAVGNAVRNPRRAAATTAALMIGVGGTLLAAFTTGVSSLEATAVRQLRAQFGVMYTQTLSKVVFASQRRRASLGGAVRPGTLGCSP